MRLNQRNFPWARIPPLLWSSLPLPRQLPSLQLTTEALVSSSSHDAVPSSDMSCQALNIGYFLYYSPISFLIKLFTTPFAGLAEQHVCFWAYSLEFVIVLVEFIIIFLNIK
jgi:hypothetical protein